MKMGWGFIDARRPVDTPPERDSRVLCHAASDSGQESMRGSLRVVFFGVWFAGEFT
jgi:hypothetical protein